MTPAQLGLYVSDDDATKAGLPGSVRVDPRTGRRIVRVERYDEAQDLIRRIEERKARTNG